jgi:uncharacterized protein
MQSALERLIEKSERKIQEIVDRHKRYLYNDVDWTQQLIIFMGHRGSGKTTMLLQRLLECPEKAIYLSLDDIFFETNRLVYVAEELYEQGYRTLFLDEIHRYEHWARDFKQMYDDRRDLKVVATGSSVLKIAREGADLSRRATLYHLQGLSFREYLLFAKGIALPILPLEELLERHHEISAEFMDVFQPDTHFKKYLKGGYYPFFMESKASYQQKLEQAVVLTLDQDIAPHEDLNYATLRTLKRLLYVISHSAPFTPNISTLAERLDSTRNTILRLIDLLAQAKIVNLLHDDAKGMSYLKKPDKIYMENPNLMTIFGTPEPNIGNARETFFFNQVVAKHKVTTSRYSDFMVDNKWTFEIGGPSKTERQIKGVPQSYLALDIKHGTGNRIPLWLFGFLY